MVRIIRMMLCRLDFLCRDMVFYFDEIGNWIGIWFGVLSLVWVGKSGWVYM